MGFEVATRDGRYCMSQGIIVVGLGPGDAAYLTVEAAQVLGEASEVCLRTRQHPTVASLPPHLELHSFDHFYEKGETFEEVYESIARRVLELGRRPEGVVYAVPGHPLIGETSVHRILAQAEEAGIPVKIVAGVSFLEPVITALGIDPFDGLQIADATTLAARHHPNLDPDHPALVVQLYDRDIAAQVKLTLMNLYPDGHPVIMVHAAGTSQQEVREVPLYELDRQDDIEHLTSLYIPPLEWPGSLFTYQDVVARLRAPGGCPWDQEQTHLSLRKHLLEETYEVLEALDAEDSEGLCEELGDLLLQVFLHTQIATEAGEFKLIDSVNSIITKLTRRHPHVFGAVHVDDASEVLRNWEEIKKEEKGEEFVSSLAGVSELLPALAQSQEMQDRAARVGFDWDEMQGVKDKVAEELRELDQAKGAGERQSELGDVLFSLVNLARWLDVDAESALRDANRRFARRFVEIEKSASEVGRRLQDMTVDEMEELWQSAKVQLAGNDADRRESWPP